MRFGGPFPAPGRGLSAIPRGRLRSVAALSAAPTGAAHFSRVTAVYADDTRSAPAADRVILAPVE
ncbi:hypothetical protein AB0N06_22710 [Streptomyces sp. NPDC051020]|uniref:hypothetical protein n=1 Tax=Streptomyces sp. NPDC051020 TaxID=3155409 RepID=UPI003433EAD4